MLDPIRSVDVYLVSMPVGGGLTDATRKVEDIGFLLVKLTTSKGGKASG